MERSPGSTVWCSSTPVAGCEKLTRSPPNTADLLDAGVVLVLGIVRRRLTRPVVPLIDALQGPVGRFAKTTSIGPTCRAEVNRQPPLVRPFDLGVLVVITLVVTLVHVVCKRLKVVTAHVPQ